jgi:alpha-tubulin suppressor-like RCC1 family protein
LWSEHGKLKLISYFSKDGQLGVGDLINKNTPTFVLNITGVVKIVAGESHTLFLTNDSSLWSVGKGTVTIVDF